MKLLVVAISLTWVSVATADDIFKHCDYVQHLDCSTFSRTDVCASNGKTYHGECELAVDHCRHKTIHKVHPGACGGTHPTPASTHGPSSMPSVVQSVFCKAMEHIDCSTHHKEKVCASNGHEFASMCFYEKARCQNTNLHIVHCMTRL